MRSTLRWSLLGVAVRPVVDGVSSAVTDEILLDTSVSIVVIIDQVFLTYSRLAKVKSRSCREGSPG